tara:strand:+ start:534 stop:1046 length:513 start_codon:yes stop_codon:yes gene_type:complete
MELHSTDDNICCICHESLNNNNNESEKKNVYKLPECSHCYHTECIITWFRNGHSTCPLCGYSSFKKAHYGLEINKYIFAQLRNYSRKKNSPKWLKDMISKRAKLNKSFTLAKKAVSDFKKNNVPRLFKDQLCEYNKIKRHLWKCRTDLWKIDKAIVSVPIVPIILPKRDK